MTLALSTTDHIPWEIDQLAFATNDLWTLFRWVDFKLRFFSVAADTSATNTSAPLRRKTTRRINPFKKTAMLCCTTLYCTRSRPHLADDFIPQRRLRSMKHANASSSQHFAF